MKSFLTLCVVLLATFTSASELVSISLERRRGSGTYLKGVAEADRARASNLKSWTPGGATNVPATDLTYVQYTTRVGIGNPLTYYDLVVDTGSSNTFCGTGIPYNRTSTSIPTGQTMGVTYGTGNVSGMEYLDQVTLAPNLVITNQSIGDALQAFDFSGVDGIIGLGPRGDTLGTLKSDENATIPTVMNNLVAQKLIQHQVLGVYFAPPNNGNDTNGVLTYGGADPSLYEGDLTYAPVTKTKPSSYYWGINVTSVTYGNDTIIPHSTAGVVDTGSTFIYLADDFFYAYGNATGATLNSSLGLTEIPASSVKNMRPLQFTISGRTFTLDVAAQLLPQSQNIALGGDAGKHYGVIAPIGDLGTVGLDFIFGMKLMERFYTVFDADNNRVGFAETKNTFTARGGQNFKSCGIQQ